MDRVEIFHFRFQILDTGQENQGSWVTGSIWQGRGDCRGHQSTGLSGTQVEPSMVTIISNRHWLCALQERVCLASLGMGIDKDSENIPAEFCKALHFETGGHFKQNSKLKLSVSENFPGIIGISEP